MASKFDDLIAQIPQIGLEHHRETILCNSRKNTSFIKKTIRDIQRDLRSCLVISAGPSLYRRRILESVAAYSRSAITTVATDGAYIQCLKAGIKPDWVITIDPHQTRIVRWFGDPDFEQNSRDDDYFARQDLDVAFRENSANENAANVALVDENRVPLVIASSSPKNVVARTSTFDRYWFCPLVDDLSDGSLTRKMVEICSAPALNTGGTVGTAATAFAYAVLCSRDIAVVGMDFGYPIDTPLKNTQEWNLTKGDPDLYPQFPEHSYYTSPTYWWYRQNFLDLLETADATITNCSGAGLLYGERVKQMRLEEWLNGNT